MSDYKVWKYHLAVIQQKQTIDLPENSKVLCVDEQFNNIKLWVLVDEDAKKEPREFRVVATGEPIIKAFGQKLDYIGTVKLNSGRFMFHIFEVIGKD